MRTLKKLKNFLTGGEAEKEEDENKSESELSEIVKEEKQPVESETKQQTAPAVEEVKKEPVVEAEPAVENKPSEVEVKTETIGEAPAIEETPIVEEVEPVMEEAEAAEEDKPSEVEVKTETAVEENVEEPAASEEAEIIEETKKDEPKPKGSESMSLLNKEANLIRAEEVEPGFKQEIIDAGAETVALCYQCGTCTGSCPSGKRTPYRIRNIIRKSLMGLKSEVMEDDSLWECVTCYACQERCPRGVAIVDVVKILRNMQSQAGKMAQAHKMTGVFVLKTGHGVPINDATMALRKKVGLNELPPTTHEFPEALEEVRTILKKTGFDTLIGYNWETGEIE
ncbi:MULTISPECIES: CoB--CoM heterodisulfide reductase subunit C [Methanobacterium]|uniref:Heterodisulfide reductase n=1 Tax=Methanobacterium bryantii TaxID=2161 RepID=A0A2A2H4N4_METBR|nr:MULTISPECIES: CoB--CoM heterodisulfide reductase subunit C [Methanobacterium]OEC84665.1 CoB--CoM heterodisulfide reductase subunit C [Methanobacterium sp. A39]PAV04254.1 heterodisulfide reductase [Methanobacterium bryantii]